MDTEKIYCGKIVAELKVCFKRHTPYGKCVLIL